MTKAELSALKELRKKINFETADFNRIGQVNPVENVTEFIKERTRLYRESWINPVIDALITKYDYKLNAVGKPPNGWNAITKSYKW